jgi:transcriptional regulator with XRE-family HTH domain
MSDLPRDPTPESDDQVEQTLGAYLRAQRELAELTLNQFAASVGISNAYLSQIERGLRRPSSAVLSSIAQGLQLSADVVEAHLPREAAEARRPKVLAAIDRDPDLTSRQRLALAEMYRSFVELNDRATGKDAA